MFRQDGAVALGVHGNTSAQDNEMFTVLDPLSGEKLGSFGGVSSSAVDVRFDWQGRLIWASAGATNGQGLADGQVTRVLDVGSARELYSGTQSFAALSPDGRTFVGSGDDLAVHLHSLETGAELTIDFVKLGAERASYGRAAWSASGRLAAFQTWGDGKGASIVLWDTVKGAAVGRVHDDNGIGDAETVFSPDDKLAAVSLRPGNKYGGKEWIFRVLELATGTVLLERPGVVRAFTRDGASVALSNDLRSLTGEVLDARTGQPQAPLFKGSGDGESVDPRELASRLHVEPWSHLNEYLSGRRALNRSPDGKVVAVGTPQGELRLLDAGTGALRKSVHAHEGQIGAIRFSPDSKRLLSYGADRLTTLWDVESGDKVATFAETGWSLRAARELVIFTPDGFYYGQRDAVRNVAVRSGTRAWPIGQFDAWLNRPDLVLEKLGSAPRASIDYYRQAHERRLARLGLGPASPPLELPEALVSREGLAPVTTERRLTLHVETVGHGAPVTFVQVYANGVALFDPKGAAAPAPGGALALDLAEGVNKLEVTSLDALGREAVPDVLRVELKPAQQNKPDLWALVVGVSQYAQAEYALRYAAKDAQDLAAAFGAPDGKRIYQQVHTRVVVDGEATREGILAAGREFLAQAQIDDRVVIFFAGHGLLDAKAGYFFATADLDFEHPEARGLAFDQMEGLFAGVRARHRLMLVDTCAAGETDEDEVARKSGALPAGVKVASRGVKRVGASNANSPAAQLLLTRELFGSLRRGSGASVIGSSSGVEFAYESAALKNGVFTAALLETLRGKDTPYGWSDALGVDNLERSVREKVLQRSGGQQHPVARETNPDDKFVIWRAGWVKEEVEKMKAAKAKAKKK